MKFKAGDRVKVAIVPPAVYTRVIALGELGTVLNYDTTFSGPGYTPQQYVRVHLDLGEKYLFAESELELDSPYKISYAVEESVNNHSTGCTCGHDKLRPSEQGRHSPWCYLEAKNERY